MSTQQVIFQYLSAGSHTLTVPDGFSNQVLVYAWGAGGGAGYAGGGGGGDEYQRTVTTGYPVGNFSSVANLPGLGFSITVTQTITVDPGVIPPVGVRTASTIYGPWTKISSASPDSRAFGGGGGFVQGIVTVSSGDTVVISVGGQGGVGPRDGSGIGGIGDTPAISFNGGTTGVGAPTDHNDDQNYGAGGGGGAATSVLVNGVPMIVAAGGGGGGGGREYQTGSAGTAGGVATATSTTPRGGTSPGGYSVGGGGGAGYPFGGAGGQTFGDDAGAATGGYGGQNYANASVTSSTLTAGSGITPGGATNSLYPKAKRGYAGYDGAVIVIFTKNFSAWIKDTTWKESNNAWVKVPSSSTTVYRTIPPTTTIYENSGTTSFVVPPGVFSIGASVTGGGGGGGGGGYGTGGESSGSGGGGGSGYTSTGSIAVTPGETLTVVVGSGGLAGAAQYSRSAGGFGGNGGASTLSRGASVLLTAAAGNGGTGGREGQNVAGGTGYNNGGSGAAVAGTVRAGGSGGASTLASGAVGVASSGGGGGYVGITPAPSGTLGAGGAGGGASDGVGSGPAGDQAANGGRGGSGYITLSYSSDPVAEIVTTGGWKSITRAWVKADDEWKPIQSGVSLVPIPSTAEVVTINLTIAANANNYVLSDFLSATSYYPGRSIVNLTVNAGVIVSSSSAGTPALIVNGLTVGDTITLTNNGTIQGRGGNGGAAGSYSSVTSGGSPATSNSCFLPGTLVSTPDGYVTIETIQVGDLVYAYNINSEFNNSAVLEPKTVTKTYEHTWEEANKVTPLLIITHSQGELIVTPEHELLCLDKVDPNSDYPGFVRADALAVGDIIYAEDGSELTITDIANGPEHYEYVYNIEVDDYHTYVANGIRVHNGTQAPRGNYSVGTTVITSNPGQPGAAGGIALEVQYTTTLVNNSIIAGGGGGGGGGGGTTGGQGGGGAGYGSGANNGTVSAGGAGTGYGGAGGARGVSGTSGTNDTNNGGVGGDPGAAIKGITNVTINTAGTITGPRIV